MGKGEKITVLFAVEKATPGTIRYKEVDEEGNILNNLTAKIGTLYVRKTTLGDSVPNNLRVTVEAR